MTNKDFSTFQKIRFLHHHTRPPSRHIVAAAARGRNYAIALKPEEDFNKEFGLEERQNDLLLTGQQQPQK